MKYFLNVQKEEVISCFRTGHQTSSQLRHFKFLWITTSAKSLSATKNTFRKTVASLDSLRVKIYLLINLHREFCLSKKMIY